MAKCYRCGYCCSNSVVVVPKTSDCNISMEHLNYLSETYSYGHKETYLTENSIVVENGCPWLRREEGGLTSCAVYAHRGPMCSGFPGASVCRIGERFNESREDGHPF
jgi:Fe-S-cluster containining protein